MFKKKLLICLLTALMTVCALTSEAATPAPAATNSPKAAAAKASIPVRKDAVKAPPASRQELQTPQASDFDWIVNKSGGYALAIPRALGSDPLENFPQAQGPMLIRSANNAQLMAVNIIDPLDTEHFQSEQPLPDFPNKQVFWKWTHSAWLDWQCSLSQQTDYYGEKLLLHAQALHDGKTYELLYVFPSSQYRTGIPQALYSLNSFRMEYK